MALLSRDELLEAVNSSAVGVTEEEWITMAVTTIIATGLNQEEYTREGFAESMQELCRSAPASILQRAIDVLHNLTF